VSVIQFHNDLGLADHRGSILHLILTRVCRSHWQRHFYHC